MVLTSLSPSRRIPTIDIIEALQSCDGESFFEVIFFAAFVIF